MLVDIDYGRTPEQIAQMSNQALTADYINFAIQQAHPQGIEGQLLRQVGRIQRKLDEAVETKATEVAFEVSELDLLKKAFGKAKFNPALAKYVVRLQDVINAQQ